VWIRDEAKLLGLFIDLTFLAPFFIITLTTRHTLSFPAILLVLVSLTDQILACRTPFKGIITTPIHLLPSSIFCSKMKDLYYLFGNIRYIY
jgi:hypothetical protein